MKKTDLKNEAILILGMHRSATSLTAKLLHELGVCLGETKDMLVANEHNQDGYFERADIVELHDSILLEHSMHWMSVRRSCEFKYDGDYSKEISEILDKLCDDTHRQFAMKDPRLCIFEPLWRRELKKRNWREKIIVVFRHPYEVAKSLEVRNNINFSYALKLWFYYNNSILNTLLDFDRDQILFIHHNEYFVNADAQIQKLIHFLGLNCSSEKYAQNIKENLRHNSAEKLQGNALCEMVMSMYQGLLDLEKGNQTLSSELVAEFNKAWETMYQTSYDSNLEDMHKFVYRLNGWTLNQLTNHKEQLIKEFRRYFAENGIRELAIYGDGLIAAGLYPILEEVDVDVTFILDKAPQRRTVLLCGKEVPVISPDTDNLKKDIFIINTVVRHADEISKLLEKYFSASKVEVLSDILFAFI